jgi:hypothetical protein
VQTNWQNFKIQELVEEILNNKFTKEKTNSKPTKPSRMNIDLVIGDSMVKNIDSEKLERAAKQKTVCHSYSGATVEPTSFPGLSYEDEGRDEKALVWAGHVTTKNGSI